MSSSIQTDNILSQFLEPTEETPETDNLRNIVKACSEAITIATAKCYAPENVFNGFSNSFYRNENPNNNTKMLLTVFNGGKALNSAVKFSKFYLIIDADIKSE
jgi:hypothetical protein